MWFIEWIIWQVWLGLLISIIVMILMMTLFSWIYKRYLQPVVVEKDNENDPAKENGMSNSATAREGFSYYFIHVINIMTNHGKYDRDERWCILFVSMTCNFRCRRLFAIYAAFVQDSFRWIAPGFTGLGQQLFQYRYVFTDSPDEESSS